MISTCLAYDNQNHEMLNLCSKTQILFYESMHQLKPSSLKFFFWEKWVTWENKGLKLKSKPFMLLAAPVRLYHVNFQTLYYN